MKFREVIILVILFALLLAFYWFQFRPSQIKKDCASKAVDNAKDTSKMRLELKRDMSDDPKLYDSLIEKKTFNEDDYNFYYEACLHKNGL